MKSKGNGDIDSCIMNLLRIPRGSIPYERLKGLNPDLIDSPATTGTAEYIADAQWLIGAYEPRAAGLSIDFSALREQAGAYGADVNIQLDE